jgi:pseudouridine-5'-phosphate glycosidase/pseudouridine kinase
VDANWTGDEIHGFLNRAKEARSETIFEPVSIAKCKQIFRPIHASNRAIGSNVLRTYPYHIIDIATPNKYELAAMHSEARQTGHCESDAWFRVVDDMGIPSSGVRNRFVQLTSTELVDEGIPQQCIQLLPFMPTILAKLGSEGVLMAALLSPDDERLTLPEHAPYILSRCTNGGTMVGGVYMRLFPAVEVVPDDKIVSVNGVGDTFLGVLVGGLSGGAKLDERLIEVAQTAAIMTLKSSKSVSPEVETLKNDVAELC